MNTLYLMAAANAILCGSIVFISICRLNVMRGAVLYRVRSQYALYVGAAVFSALQPWWGYWPTWSGLAVATALLFGMLCDSIGWVGGAPAYQQSCPGSLRRADGTDLDSQLVD